MNPLAHTWTTGISPLSTTTKLLKKQMTMKNGICICDDQWRKLFLLFISKWRKTKISLVRFAIQSRSNGNLILSIINELDKSNVIIVIGSDLKRNHSFQSRHFQAKTIAFTEYRFAFQLWERRFRSNGKALFSQIDWWLNVNSFFPNDFYRWIDLLDYWMFLQNVTNHLLVVLQISIVEERLEHFYWTWTPVWNISWMNNLKRHTSFLDSINFCQSSIQLRLDLSDEDLTFQRQHCVL